jgi:uncharacterized protein YbjT (DUF2867 family)
MNNKQNVKASTLVLGATGKTGSRVLNRLQQLDWPVRPGSRSAAIPFDWEDVSTWDAALEGMKAVYIAFQPDLCVPGSAEAIGTLSQLAVKKGVQKLVLLSGRGEPEAIACEEAMIKAGAPYWTVIRASWFFQNFSEGFMLEPLRAGYVEMPAGPVGEPFIDVEDIADIAVAALTQDGHHAEIYEVTSPRLLTFEDAVNEIAAATGRHIAYQQIPIDQYVATLAVYEVPQEYISLLTYLFTEILDGRNANIADGVERALGRKPTDFSTYVARTLATGIWDPVTA